MPNFVDSLNLNENPAVVPINVVGSFDNQTVKIGRFPCNGKIVAVSFATGSALGSNLGIDVKNGSNTVVSCTDNLNGIELKTTGLSNTSVTSSSDLYIVFDDYAAATMCSVIIYIHQQP